MSERFERDDSSAAGITADVIADEYRILQGRNAVKVFALSETPPQAYIASSAEAVKVPVPDVLFFSFVTIPITDAEIGMMLDAIRAAFGNTSLVFLPKTKRDVDGYEFPHWKIEGTDILVSYTTFEAVENGRYVETSLPALANS